MTELSEIKSAVGQSAAAAQAAAATSAALEVRLFTAETGWIPIIKQENEHCATERASIDKSVTKIITEIENIKEKHKHDDMKDYIHYASAPIVVALHGVLRHFGINI